MDILDEDSKYRQLRKEVTDKAFTSQIISTVAGIMLFGAFAAVFVATGPFSAGIATMAGVAAGALGLGSVGLGLYNFRREHDLQLDYEELDNMRRADYLGKVIEKTEGKVNPVVLERELAGNDRPTDWGKRVSSGDLARSESTEHLR